jgi:hypothetical protein
MEAVKLRLAEAEALHIASPNREGGKTVTAGDVLSRYYARNLLVRPDENDFDEYLKHVFFVLAAVETTNIFFQESESRSSMPGESIFAWTQRSSLATRCAVSIYN